MPERPQDGHADRSARLALRFDRRAEPRARRRPSRPPTVRSPASTSPGSAAFCSRSATFTTSPVTNDPPARDAPATTSPVLTPMRIASFPSKSSPKRCCIASAACRALSAWSSSAAGAPKTAITASPANFSTVPPVSSISSRIAS